MRRFESALQALPESQRDNSLLPLMHNYQKPKKPINGSMAPTDRFRAAVQDAKVGPDKDMPHITPQIIAKYVSDLRLLGLLVNTDIATNTIALTGKLGREQAVG